MLMKICNRFNTQRGIGLLELMLSLAIIAILLVMATRYYRTARTNQLTNDTISLVNAYISAETQYYMGSNAYIGDFDKLGLPTASKKNPWDGATDILGKQAGTTFTLTFANVPAVTCTNLASMINNNYQAADPIASCKGTELQIIYK